MKKFLYTLLAVATLGLAAGCQREQSVKEEGPMVDVSFNVNIQGLQTKAFSDGTQAKDLYVAVYANRTDGAVFMEGISTDQIGAFADGLTATVKLRLVRGENYDIVFWAQAPGAPYTLDKAAKTLTVSTEGKANDELRDAFYGVWTGTPVTAPQDVTLQRPFAQINVLTTADDWAALQNSGIPFAGSSMKFTAPTVLELTTGKATTPKEYNLAFDAIDPDAVNIPGYEQTHKYIAMNYVLAGDRLTEKLNFSIYRAANDPLGDFEVVNVPFQRNYRTNVWGEIFTVEGEFHVTIDPVYEDDIDWPMEGEEQTLSITPGSTLAAAAQMDDNNIWHVSLKKDATLDFTGVASDATGATADYKSSNAEVGGFITNKAGEFTALKAGETTVTVNFTADGYKPAAMTFVVTVTEDAPVAGEVTDVIDLPFTGVTGTSYASWEGLKGSASNAEYAGNNAGGNSSVQMRSNNSNSGIVSTKSGGKLVKVSVKWNSNTSAGRTVDIYGSNTAYTSASDLYSAETQGTKIGSISIDENTTTVTVPATASYSYVGIRSNSGALYLDEIDITWSDGGTTPVEPEPTVTGIKVVSLPSKTEYTVGEYINWAGFKANAIMSDQTEKELASNQILHDRSDAFADSDISDACVVNIYYYDGTNAHMDITTSFTVKVVAAQPSANDGSQAHPFTVAEVRDYIDGLNGAISENEVYVTGTICSIANNGQFSAAYGNASFFISDDGQTTSDQFEAYRVLYLGNRKWVEGDATVAVGDEVIICGKVKLYSPSNGDPIYETHQSNADNYSGYLYSLNGQTEIVNNTPVITATDISGVPADGVTNATTAVTITNIDDSWTVTANCDGTVVTNATWANDVLTYTVAANTGAARQGTITLKVSKGDVEVTKEIKVSQLSGSTESGEYDTNVSWTKGSSCYDDNKITVNGTADVANLKFGTSNNFGQATVTLPAGTTKVTFYAVAWKNAPATMKFTFSDTESYSFNIAANEGATGNAPYTITVADTDKYTLTLNAALAADTTVTVETCAGETNNGKRAFLFGVQAQ